ncbi:hypothetical protein [Methanobrevibacter sp.]|uniref:hypothetical protein n=1 Tax=Methanobrevibacter sp. TaxID=66852 RepID=UPI0038906A1F
MVVDWYCRILKFFFNFAGEQNSYYTDNYGRVSISVNNEPGKYYVGISNPVSGEYTIKKITILPQIESHDLVKMYGNSSSFIVRILGLDALPVGAGQTVRFIINGPYGTATYNIQTDSNGYATRTIGLVPGKYNVTTTYNGRSVFNTIKVLSPIESSNLVKMYGNSSSFVVRIFGLNGNPVGAGETVTFKITGPSGTATYNIQTDNNGYATRTIGLVPAEYTVKTTYGGVSVYNNITVLSPILSNNLVKYYKNDSSFVVRIFGLNGNPVGAGETVTFKITGPSGTATYNIQTDSDGYATRTIGLVPSSYTVKTTYGGITATNSITVLSTIITRNLTMAYNDGNYFSAIILDGNGNPYPNQNLTFKINSVTYNRVTDNYGLAIRTIGLAKGTYKIKTTYNGLTASNTVVVGSSSPTHRNTVIQNVNVDTNLVNPCSLTVRLKDSSGNYLSEKSVLVKFSNNVFFNRLTDSNGYVYFNDLVPTGTYSCNISFSGDTYYTKSSSVKSIHVNKRGTVLTYGNMGGGVLGDEIFDFNLKDTLGNNLNNQNLLITIGNSQYHLTTNKDGNARLDVGLENDGEYNVNMLYSGNSYYQSSNNSTLINVSSRGFSYSVLIPNYVNVTNPYWTIYDNSYTHNFVEQTGLGGIIRMPVVRELSFSEGNDSYSYYIGHTTGEGSISYGESEEIVFDDGVVYISSDLRFTNVTYSGFIRSGVSQISAVYSQVNAFGEDLWLLVNGEDKLHIGFSSPLLWNENGIRFGFMGNQPIQVNNVLNRQYNTFNNYNSLVFADTGETVSYSSNFMSIVNLPSKERVRSVFNLEDDCIVKDEWLNFDNNIHVCGIDLVQSYAVADCLVNTGMVEYLLDFSDGMILNAYDSGFSSFLTALSCVWMFDGSAVQVGDVFNVSVYRGDCAVVMSGADSDFNAYVHALDPVLGLDFSGGNVNDTYLCRALCSLLFGDIESKALGFSDRLSNSSLDVIFSEILNGGNFTVLYENGTLIIQLSGNGNCSFVFDMDSGLVYDWSYYDNFSYKGAISTQCNSNCPFLFLSTAVWKLHQQVRYNVNLPDNDFQYELSDKDKRLFTEAGAALALSSSTVLLEYSIPLLVVGAVSAPVVAPFLLGVALIVVAYELNCYASNGNNDAFGNTIYGFVQGTFL